MEKTTIKDLYRDSEKIYRSKKSKFLVGLEQLEILKLLGL